MLRSGVGAVHAACARMSHSGEPGGGSSGLIPDTSQLNAANLANSSKHHTDLGNSEIFAKDTQGDDDTATHSLGERIFQPFALTTETMYVAFRRYIDGKVRSFAFTVKDNDEAGLRILVLEDTIQPPNDSMLRHLLIEDGYSGVPGGKFPIRLQVATSETCRFVYNTNANVFGPDFHFSLYVWSSPDDKRDFDRPIAWTIKC